MRRKCLSRGAGRGGAALVVASEALIDNHDP
jgi:hypothetical protein